MRLSPIEIQQIKDAGVTGELSTYMADRYGSGKRSHVTLILQVPVKKPIELREPDGSNVVYIQYDEDWKMFPPNAPTLKRTIRIAPEAGDPKQSSVTVERADGALQGFGLWWPKTNSGNPVR